jgi:hypothetical protein
MKLHGNIAGHLISAETIINILNLKLCVKEKLEAAHTQAVDSNQIRVWEARQKEHGIRKKLVEDIGNEKTAVHI